MGFDKVRILLVNFIFLSKINLELVSLMFRVKVNMYYIADDQRLGVKIIN